MAEPHVISALVAKRAELAGEVQKMDKRRLALKEHIAHIDAVLRLFRYAGDPAAIKPKRKNTWLFRRGELARMVGDIEREARKPLHKEEIAAEVVRRKGWAADPDLVETVAEKVKDTRKRQSKPHL